ncbi:acetyl-CoA carboxylase biotin carboxylase subunit [Vulcanimicrobium alpinum]|uniref:biotin carboxylase n=1 Tax=Vulcanimicrobium alpinum TaxID=3016050 RepID=A0AAN2C997_UNVUL|nr:acetyl-CoA carboxylase biotin carboxylase subunit [Vulcanimicrobium alpinum]BDE06074.1 acetyl-CoA carboxylase biotin carboxylase subunit [Vulcanimicrobium alpinum]
MSGAPFRKILVANRGEIAIRVMRSAKELGCATVAVYSDADRDALHVRYADEAFLLGPAAPSQSYLNADRLLEVAQRAGVDAIHPGYGFFAENAPFARRVIDTGITWIGPHPEAIDAMGDKIRARQAMVAAGVPVVPGGTDAIGDADAARVAAEKYGLPLALKASGGGGGKGLKVARSVDELAAAFSTAQREATAYFGNPTIYVERYLENPKHIELQVLADKHGNVMHVGERDCSLQRRHQKLWEEAPALIPENVREGLRAAGVQAARAIRYDSAGTIECLVSGDAFYFLEMNTRIQVEHTVSEEISGIDLVREQILVAAGRPLSVAQADITFRGHAIEVRVNAEDPAQGFRPAPGTVARYKEPGGFGVRVDSAAFPGFTITPDYDSMIAKLIVRGRTREETLARLARAIDEYVIEGVPTTLPLLRALCDFAPVRDASYGTATLEPFAASLVPAASNGARAEPAGCSESSADGETLRVEVNGKLFRVRFVDLPLAGAALAPAAAKPVPKKGGGGRKPGAAAAGNDVIAPMHGVVVEIPAAPGASVSEGDVVAVIEAMKMMNEIRAHKSGTVEAVHVAAGTTVEARTPLLTIA